MPWGLTHDFADFFSQCLQGERFVDKIYPPFQNTLMGNDIRRVTRHEQAANIWPQV